MEPENETLQDLLTKAGEFNRSIKNAKIQRDFLVRKAKDAGASYQELANVLGITRGGVQAILKPHIPPTR